MMETHCLGNKKCPELTKKLAPHPPVCPRVTENLSATPYNALSWFKRLFGGGEAYFRALWLRVEISRNSLNVVLRRI